MKKISCFFVLLTSMLFCCCSSDSETKAETPPPAGIATTGKTLVAFYSYTGNCRAIVDELTRQLKADVVEIKPVDKTQKYEANNYAIGTQLLNAIKDNPDDAGSYPPIDPTSTNPTDYDNIIVVTPLWWSQMAAIMQTYLFQNSERMAGKCVALVVSSHSSPISGVVSDARRLLPGVTWAGDALWINNSNRSNTSSLLAEWLQTLNLKTANMESKTFNITIGGVTHEATLADNSAAQALVDKLSQAPVTLSLDTNGDFEIWGPLGFSLPTANQHVDAQPGDVVLYGGSNICIFYGTNSYSYTPLGRLEGLSASELKTFLHGGQNNIAVTLSLPSTATALHSATTNQSAGGNHRPADNALYSLGGQRLEGAKAGARLEQLPKGIYIKNGVKVAM